MTNFSAHMFSRAKKVMLTNSRQCNLHGIFSVHVSHLIVSHKTHVTTKNTLFHAFFGRCSDASEDQGCAEEVSEDKKDWKSKKCGVPLTKRGPVIG